ncbi:FIST signal transduction protein [Tundrisphaera lichenicola]|uniref:FIST signal transduction protein n=1 Tax=Tundrisphaera lichenicola TaxID=2029860 RepID=UPI003EBF70D9
MRCASALSTSKDCDSAVEEVVEQLVGSFEGNPADLAMVFASIHHAEALAAVGTELMGRGLVRHVLGCTGETIIGGGREIEAEPALSAWAIRLPETDLRTIRVDGPDEDLGSLAGLSQDPADLLILGDPFSFAADPWLKKTNERYPGLRILGGMASASQTPGGNRLLLDGEAHRDGAVALLLKGEVKPRTLVSQGCRPIGRPMIVTKAERNIIRELGRRPALEVLRELFEDLSSEDQARLQSGLHIGRVINEYQGEFRRGDFLVRNVMGADDAGGIAITDLVRVGQTIQFQVRDAETADEDLRTLIRAERLDRPRAEYAGALVFSCNGRGTRLFDQPDHDVGVLRELFGPIPVAGFFAMGEIGPVGGQNFVHGYTASVVLFEEPH